MVARQEEGCYVYCLVPGGQEVSMGPIGLGGQEVYSIVHKDITALVHASAAVPYQSKDIDLASSWIMAHHKIVKIAWERWDSVLPMAFNTIIRGSNTNTQGSLGLWLETEYDYLKGKLELLKGKSEYGVQVFWDAVLVANKVAEANPEVRKLGAEISSMPKGMAYMYRQKLGSLLKREMESRAAELIKDLYSRFSGCACSLRVDTAKKSEPGLQMIMNVSCLVSADRYPQLEGEINMASQMEGLSLRLTGPWPPYSFC
jgi:hypothetical protein